MAKRFLIQDEENSFGAESMKQLIQKNREELENLKKELEKVEENKKNTTEKISNEKIAANRMPSTSNPTDEFSIDKTGAEAAVNKKKPLYGKKITELDIRAKELSERIKDLEELIKTQEETLEGMGRQTTTKTEHRIIKATDFKSIVENYTKINLSESDIIDILVETQNPIMTKSEIIESIQNKLIIEADMNRDVSGSFEGGTNEYSELLGSDLARQIANQSFEEIARNIQRKTGKQRVTMDDIQRLLMTSLIDSAKKEYAYGIERLEQKAVDLILKKFKIHPDEVDFDVKIVGLPVQLAPTVAQMSNLNPNQIRSVMSLVQNPTPQNLDRLSEILQVKFGNIEKEGLKSERGSLPPPQGKTAEEFEPKIKRRRFTNAMMHGSARKTQNLHFEDDQFREENPELSTQYGNIMAANDASYWFMDDQSIKREAESGIHAGNSRVKVPTVAGENPKIIAQGMVYPILLHELGKAIPELVALWSLPPDVEEREYILDKTDNLEAETNDIRLGPTLWAKFIEQIPIDNQDVIAETWKSLQLLSDFEFNNIIVGLLNNNINAQRKVQELANEAIERFRREDSDSALGVYDDDDESDEDEGDVAIPGEEEEEDEVLKRILGGQKGEEGPEEPKDLDDMSNEELEDLMNSAVADEDYAFAAQIRDILKNR